MTNRITHLQLKTKQRSLRQNFPENIGLRVHRSISWIGRSEKAQEDPDAQFLFLWVSFNAAYADEDEFQTIHQGERASFAVVIYPMNRGRTIALCTSFGHIKTTHFQHLVSVDPGETRLSARWSCDGRLRCSGVTMQF